MPESEWSVTHHRLIFSAAITVRRKDRNAKNARCFLCAGKGKNDIKRAGEAAVTSVSLLDEYEKRCGRKGRNPAKGLRYFLKIRSAMIFQDAGEDKPWEHAEEWVPLLFAEWERTKEKLLPVFKTRKSRCSQDDMLNGVCCLIASLHWTMGSLSKVSTGRSSPGRILEQSR